MKIECKVSLNGKGHVVIVSPDRSRFQRIYRLSDFIYLLQQDRTELMEALAEAEEYQQVQKNNRAQINLGLDK